MSAHWIESIHTRIHWVKLNFLYRFHRINYYEIHHNDVYLFINVLINVYPYPQNENQYQSSFVRSLIEVCCRHSSDNSYIVHFELLHKHLANEIVSDRLICTIHTSLNSDHNSSWNFIRFQPSITGYKIQHSYICMQSIGPFPMKYHRVHHNS